MPDSSLKALAFRPKPLVASPQPPALALGPQRILALRQRRHPEPAAILESRIRALVCLRVTNETRNMSKFSYPGFFPCETEWTSRSLTDLVSHLNERYRQPTERRIEAIRGLLSQIGPSGHQRCEGYHRLAKIFRALCETIEEHVWLKDHILGPAVVNVERGLRLDPSASDALCEMIMKPTWKLGGYVTSEGLPFINVSTSPLSS